MRNVLKVLAFAVVMTTLMANKCETVFNPPADQPKQEEQKPLE